VVDTLRAIAGQIARIGNNVNQIARVANVAVLADSTPSPNIAVLPEAAAALDRLRGDVRCALGVQPVCAP
jgi:hypothetical protein